MSTKVLTTNVTLGNLSESVARLVDPFRDTLNKLTGGAGAGDPAASLDVTPLTFQSTSGQDLEDGLVDGAGAAPVAGYDFAFGSGNRATPQSNPFLFAHVFGMEIQEFFSWWYEGTPGTGQIVDDELVAAGIGWTPGTLAGIDSGIALMTYQISQQNAAAQRAGGGGQYDPNGPHNYQNMYVFPICVTAGESGGWYKEAVTLKKMQDGKWSDGTSIRIRLGDEPRQIHGRTFPNVATPAPSGPFSPLQDMKDGIYNCCEYNMPLGDSSQINGMFPNYPDGADGVIEAGFRHYYTGSWQTPYRGRVLLVNKTYFDGLTLVERTAITAAAYQCAMTNLAYMLQGQDAIIKHFQSLGGIIHESLPRDYLNTLREGTDEIMETYAATGEDSLAEYQTAMRHTRAFTRANSVRWRAGNLDRRFRFDSRLDYVPTLQSDVKL